VTTLMAGVPAVERGATCAGAAGYHPPGTPATQSSPAQRALE